MEWDEERAAGDILAALLGGTATQRDVQGGGEQVHDVDLVVSGRHIAVEVTVDTYAPMRAANNNLARHNWHYPQLDNHWSLWMKPSATAGLPEPFNVRDVRSVLPGALQQLELLGVERVQPRSMRLPVLPAVQAVIETLNSVGVEWASAFPGDTGRVYVMEGSVGWHHSDVGAEVTERHIARPDNQTKLRNAEADERHLFIWVDGTRTGDLFKLWDGPQPEAVPRLPDFVAAVWVATAGPGRSSHVYEYRTGGGWCDWGVSEIDREPQ